MHQGKDWTYLNISKHAGEGIVKVDFRVVASTAVKTKRISSTHCTGDDGFSPPHWLQKDSLPDTWALPASDMGSPAFCQIIRSSIRSQSQYNMELNWIVKHCEVSRKHQLIVGSLIESKLAANQTCVAQRRAANSTRAKQQKPDT